MAKTLKFALVVAAMLVSTPAMALTVGYNFTPLTEGLQVVPSSIDPIVDVNAQGNCLGFCRDLWESTAEAGTGFFNSVRQQASATYDFAVRTQLTMMWGSPDGLAVGTSIERNIIEFYLADVLQATYTGSQLLTLSGAIPGSGFVTAIFSGETFDSVKLIATQLAFEHAFAPAQNEIPPDIPLPAGLILLLSGLAGLGAMARGRKRTA